MALTTAQLEAHLGRFLRTLVGSLSTPNQLNKLEQTMRLLLPAGKRYVTSGTLGTQADRQEAMTTFRDAAYQKLTNLDPSTAALQHYLSAHWNIDED